MASFEVVRHTHLEIDEVWARLTDWERHGDFIPFTTVALAGLIRSDVGAEFVARTKVGPLTFDDPMEVTEWQPPRLGNPGVCRIEKRGRVVLGWALLTVRPTVEGTTIYWLEDARFRFAGPIGDWINRASGRKIFGRLVDGLLDDRQA